MNSRTAARLSHTVATLCVVLALASPCAAHAVGIGEIELQSKLGEPLLAQVELTAENNERIGVDCLSLAAPDPHEENANSFLTRIGLSLKTDGPHQYAVIRSQHPFNDFFAKLRLQVKCPGMGSISRTLTILPDFDMPPPETITAPDAVHDDTSPAATRSPALTDQNSSDAIRATRQGNELSAQPTAKRSQSKIKNNPSGKTTKSGNKHISKAAQTPRKTGSAPAFKLKLSGDPIDESRIGKISAEEREILLARQKLLDSDDQMANFLALQHQVKQLQNELGEIKLKLGQLAPLPASALPEAPANAPKVNTSGAKPPVALKQAIAAVQPDETGIPRGLLVGIGLLLAVLLLWMRLRHHTRTKAQQAIEPILKHPGKIPAIIPITSYAATEEADAGTETTEPPAPAAEVPVAAPAIRKEEAPPNTAPAKDQKELNEEDAMLEEAELYAVHGHPNKAAEILREIVMRNPTHTGAWELLLSVFSAQGKAEEFEKAARSFLSHNKNSDSWKMIQALGRTLAPDNPLYAGNGNFGAAAMFLPQIALNKRRPVGDILVEMGAISALDMKGCLSNFNPKVHGRFGGYLISRKLISHAQLNEALMMQQEGNDGAGHGALPSLQDMENLLTGFDPKRDGTIGEYLVAQKLITPVQLDKVLRQQDPDTPEADDVNQPGSDSAFDTAFEWDQHPEHEKATRSREITPSRSAPLSQNLLKPLNFELAPLAPPLPNIDLNLDKDAPTDESGKKA